VIKILIPEGDLCRSKETGEACTCLRHKKHPPHKGGGPTLVESYACDLFRIRVPCKVDVDGFLCISKNPYCFRFQP